MQDGRMASMASRLKTTYSVAVDIKMATETVYSKSRNHHVYMYIHRFNELRLG